MGASVGRGLWATRARWLRVAIVFGSVTLLMPSAAAATNFTWSGAASVPSWSTGANWVGGHAPSGTIGTSGFPLLASTCKTCYQSNNNFPTSPSPLSAGGISIDDGVGYFISGNTFRRRFRHPRRPDLQRHRLRRVRRRSVHALGAADVVDHRRLEESAVRDRGGSPRSADSLAINFGTGPTHASTSKATSRRGP